MISSVGKLRVAIVGLFHESNTFIPEPTTLGHYQRSTLLRGEEIRAKYGNAHHEISGFFQILDAKGIEAVPILFAHTSPWGVITDETRMALWKIITDGLDAAGPVNGILAAPHGAAVGESVPDLDGWWLSQLRTRVGESVPIIATMDPHVNLSSAMVSACQALIAYRENPHLDQRQRGIEAAELMVRTLHGEIRPVVAAAFPPIAINIERQLTSAEPMLSVQRELNAVRSLPGVLSASLAMGFPYADIEDMGSAFVVVTDNDTAFAQLQANRLARWLADNCEQFRGELINPEDALEKAITSPKPVGLLDMGDNQGGGAPGDSMVIAHLCHQTSSLRVLMFVPDAESARLAREAGVGNRVRLKIGGKLPMTPAPPLETEVTVISLHDGKYTETQPRHGGKTGGDTGPTAVVRTDSGLTVMLMTHREGVNSSAQPLITCGLHPKEFDVVILKGVHAPVGAYAEICPTLIRVNTPGVTSADMDTLPYAHRRRPLFPFEALPSLTSGDFTCSTSSPQSARPPASS